MFRFGSGFGVLSSGFGAGPVAILAVSGSLSGRKNGTLRNAAYRGADGFGLGVGGTACAPSYAMAEEARAQYDRLAESALQEVTGLMEYLQSRKRFATHVGRVRVPSPRGPNAEP